MGTSRPRRAAGWLVGLLAIAFALKLGAVVWALDRGFEIGDEGYALLNLNHPRDAPVVFQYYRLLNPFDDDERFGVIGARRLRLVAELLGSAALIAGVFSWARTRLFPSGSSLGIPFLTFCALGALLGTASRSLSYNDVTNLCAYSAIGALFHLIALPPGDAGRRGRSVAALAAGVCTGLQLGVKFPTALLLPAFVAFALTFLLRSTTPRERWRVAALYAGGIVLAIALYASVDSGLAPLFAELRRMPAVASSSGYDPLALLRFYAKGEVVTAIQVAVTAAVFGFALLLFRRLFGASDSAVAAALACGALALAAGVSLLHPFFLHPTLLFFSAFLAFALILLFALDSRARRDEPARWETLAPLALLVGLPLIEIAGTDVPISKRLATHALPLFAALGALSLDLRARAGLARLHTVLVATLLAGTGVLFVRHQLLAPYGLPQSAFDQRYEVAGLPGLQVDAATRDFLESVAARMRAGGFRPGDPVVAFDFMPGLVFYLRGTSPGFTLYVADNPQLNCLNVNRFYHAPPFLILGRPMSAEQAACLESFTFPDDFRSIGDVRFPYEAVYEDFGIRDFSHVHLYAPRDREPAR